MTEPPVPTRSGRSGSILRLGRRQREKWSDEHELAHAVNGTVVGAAVMVAASVHGTLGEVVLAVVATLLVYWAVERYSEALAVSVRGPGPSRARIVAVLGHGWPMLQASYAPLVALLVTTALGADLQTAVLVALGLSTALLTTLGHAAARRAGATRLAAFGWAAVSALLGLAVVALKLALH
jgi:hypothetical protein